METILTVEAGSSHCSVQKVTPGVSGNTSLAFPSPFFSGTTLLCPLWWHKSAAGAVSHPQVVGDGCEEQHPLRQPPAIIPEAAGMKSLLCESTFISVCLILCRVWGKRNWCLPDLLPLQRTGAVILSPLSVWKRGIPISLPGFYSRLFIPGDL